MRIKRHPLRKIRANLCRHLWCHLKLNVIERLNVTYRRVTRNCEYVLTTIGHIARSKRIRTVLDIP
jgi:hypothetical protein